MIILKQKVFHIDPKTGQVISTAELLRQRQQAGGSLKSALSTAGSNAAAADAAKAAQRAANKANPGLAAFKAGQAKATVNKGTLMNTWNKMGTAGKVGTAAAALGATVLAAKGVKSLFDKKKEEDK